ncbi:MAG: FHA domain-containing protein [Ignavibacteriae bacterium]|nr:FHA domain-containing protein [Ignavibacteriota bacterium]
MKKLIFLIGLLFVSANIYSQSTISLNLRDIDYTEFQQIKLYLNILDTNGKAINDIDSTRITIVEKNTDKKVSPFMKNFFKSDEGMVICFVIDASNSMDGAPLNNIKEGILHILPEMRPQDKMAISIFNDKFLKKTGFETDREILRNNINDLTTGGSSSEIFLSVNEATKWLKSVESPKRKVMILLSDGDDNGTDIKIGDCIKGLENSGISVFSIGTVADNRASRNTLINIEKIAASTKDGKYYKINTPEDMKNIIPLIYDRIKDEYVLTYFSYAPVSTDVKGEILVKVGETTYKRDFEYKSPAKIIKNAPAVSFWETKEFLYGSIGGGVILIALSVFLVININKKKRYKAEKEQEQMLREEEARINEERFGAIQKEYDNLLDQLENASVITDSDKMRISELENKIQDASKTMIGVTPNIDYRRRTMILSSKSSPSMNVGSGQASLCVNSGSYTGQTFTVSPMGASIGRQQGDIVLQDSTISRMHARILMTNGQFYIEDLGSTNGTFVNEKRITSSVLSNNDTVRLGNVSLTFKI